MVAEGEYKNKKETLGAERLSMFMCWWECFNKEEVDRLMLHRQGYFLHHKRWEYTE